MNNFHELYSRICIIFVWAGPGQAYALKKKHFYRRLQTILLFLKTHVQTLFGILLRTLLSLCQTRYWNDGGSPLAACTVRPSVNLSSLWRRTVNHTCRPILGLSASGHRCARSESQRLVRAMFATLQWRLASSARWPWPTHVASASINTAAPTHDRSAQGRITGEVFWY